MPSSTLAGWRRVGSTQAVRFRRPVTEVTLPHRIAAKRKIWAVRAAQDGLLLGHGQFRAPVLGAALFGIVRGQRSLFSEALRRDSVRSHPVVYEQSLYGVGPIQG